MQEIEELLEIMATLRDPGLGCPWDRKQSFASIVPHTLEEAYEVADAIERGDMDDLRDELGDLLFQIVFYAQMAREVGDFEFRDIVRGCCDKLERRHPHVFDDGEVADAEGQSVVWESLKEEERKAKAGESTGVLDGVALALPALIRAVKLQRRAARVGFDWSDWHPILEKLYEESGELQQAVEEGSGSAAVEEELGDLLFTCVNLARHLAVDPEQALRRANKKFEDRFRYLESKINKAGADIDKAGLDEMDALWEEAKSIAREKR